MVEALSSKEKKGQLSLTVEADKAAAEYLYQISHITEDPPLGIEEVVPIYPQSVQTELLKQGATLGIFPDQDSVKWDKEMAQEEGREIDYRFRTQNVVAQYARARVPSCRETEDNIVALTRQVLDFIYNGRTERSHPIHPIAKWSAEAIKLRAALVYLQTKSMLDRLLGA